MRGLTPPKRNSSVCGWFFSVAITRSIASPQVMVRPGALSGHATLDSSTGPLIGIHHLLVRIYALLECQVDDNLDIDTLLAWCKQEVVWISKHVELLRTGRMKTQEVDEQGEVTDTTSRTISEWETKRSTLENLVANRERQLSEPS